MQYEEIIARLNRAGGNLRQLAEHQRDDERAIKVEVYGTRVPHLFVRVTNTPDASLVAIRCESHGGGLVPLDSFRVRHPDTIRSIRNELLDEFGGDDAILFNNSPHIEDQRKICEFTNYIARTLS